MSKNQVLKIVQCFITVNKNKLFHHIHHEFIKGTCSKIFDYADGFVVIYLLFCMFPLKNSAYIFMLISLGVGCSYS